jgi:hypothetical protein
MLEVVTFPGTDIDEENIFFAIQASQDLFGIKKFKVSEFDFITSLILLNIGLVMLVIPSTSHIPSYDDKNSQEADQDNTTIFA